MATRQSSMSVSLVEMGAVPGGIYGLGGPRLFDQWRVYWSWGPCVRHEYALAAWLKTAPPQAAAHRALKGTQPMLDHGRGSGDPAIYGYQIQWSQSWHAPVTRLVPWMYSSCEGKTFIHCEFRSQKKTKQHRNKYKCDICGMQPWSLMCLQLALHS